MKTIFSRNFVLFEFFVSKSSTCKRYNSAFEVQSTSLPRAEVDSGRAITVRNEVRSQAGLRYGTKRGSDRQYCCAERSGDSRVISRCGTGRVEELYDFGSERDGQR